MSNAVQVTKRLIDAGYNRERAVLIVTKTYNLSMRSMELLHFAVIKYK